MKHNFSKKALSLFLVVLMLMSSWVFFPMEASAAAGGYYVQINWTCNSTGPGYSRDYDGYDNRDDDNCIGISLFYKDINGTDSTEKEAYWNLKNEMESSTGTYTTSAQFIGFPTRIYFYNDHGYYGWWKDAKATINEIQISADGKNWETLWAGSIVTNSNTDIKYAELDLDGNTKTSSDASVSAPTTDNWDYPYANTFVWTANGTTVSGDTINNMTCPAVNGNLTTQDVSVIAYDQFGVQMFDPTWTVTDNNDSSEGMKITEGAAQTATITVPYSMNIAGITNDQIGTVTATWDGAGDDKTSSKTFTITDAQYTATFTNLKDASGNAIADITSTGVYYGCQPTVPTETQFPRVHAIGDEDFKFTAWSPAIPTAGMTANATYTAQYDDGTFVTAIYTEANKALEAASAILTDPVFAYKYNDEAKIALNKAYSAINTTKYLGRTQQERLNEMVATLNAAIAYMATDPALQEYDVIFMDGDRLIDIVQVLYGKGVPADKIPSQEGFTKEPDSENHYTVSGWDTDLTSITENVLVYATYAGEAHTMEESGSVTANCVHGAGTEYICSVEGCGYKSYESTGDINPDIHENVAQNIITAPTCIETGVAHEVCLDCEVTLDDNIVIPAKGHSYQSEINPQATCHSEGTRTFTCTQCPEGTEGHVITEVIPMLQHNFTAGTSVPASCTEGAYTIYSCDGGCGKSYKKYTSQKLDHSFGGWTYADNADGTKVIATGTCQHSGCSETISVEVANRNVISIDITTQPTCTTAGSATVNYTTGNTTTVAIPANSKAHASYTTTYVAAECGKKGSVTVTCDDCSTQISYTEIAALNHSYSDWDVTTEANCTTAGSKTRTCANCNDVQIEAIPATGHKYVSVTGNCTKDTYKECACGDRIDVTPYLGHSYTGKETVIREATCTTDGIKTVQCANCEVVTVVYITERPTEHTYTEIYNKAPDCHGKGYKVEICSICGTIRQGEYGTQLTHDYEVVENMSFPASCEGKGVTMKQCTLCGQYEQTIIEPLGHTSEVIPAVDPTCTATGLTAGSKCSVCDKILTAQTTVPANGHTSELDWEVEESATCISAGYEVGKCKTCGTIIETKTLAATGHSFPEEWTTVNPTCTDAGSQTRICTNDGCGATETVVLSALGHNMTAGTPVAPTCTTSGYTPYTCSRTVDGVACGHTYNIYDASQPAKGHTWGEWTTSTNPTAATEGEQRRDCEDCDAFETATLPKLGHDMIASTAEGDYQAPTCTEGGFQVYVCNTHTGDAACGYTYTQTLPKTGHTLETNKVDATCTKEGYVNTHCTGCDFALEEITLPMLQHEYVKTGTVAPTCTANGYDVYTCETCTSSYNVITLAPVAHTYNKLDTSVEPTCTDAGRYTFKCETCTASYSYDVPAKGHTYSTSKTTADCTSNEITTYTCTACTEGTDGHSYTEITAVATGHNWGDWTVDKAATDTVDGKMTRVCQNNATHIEEITIPATGGHTWGTGARTTEPTCTTAGVMTYTCVDAQCQVCIAENKKGTKTEPIPALGHTESLVVVAASCDTKGEAKVICTVTTCGAVIKTEEIPAKGHNYTNAVVTKEATCSATGVITMTCASCDNITTAEIATNANAHKYVEGTSVAPTCTSIGYATLKCEYCVSSYTIKTAEAKGHSETSREVVKNTATCTSDGFAELQCYDCNAIVGTKVLPKLGHNYPNEWTTVEASTCTATGLEKRVCGYDSNHVETRVIAAKGHDMVEGTTHEATCTVGEYTEWSCSRNCGHNYKVYDENKPATGHIYENWNYDYTGEKIKATATCSCGASITVEVPKQAERLISAIEITTQPTCQTTGKATVTFDRGAEQIEVELPQNPDAHTISTVYTAADCTDTGSVVSSCPCGNYNETTTLPAMGHFYGAPVVTPATCVAEGSAVVACTRSGCGATLTTTIAKSTNHVWGDWSEDVAGTLTRHCTVTGCNVSENATIPSGGHKYDTSTTPVVVTEAKCTTEGTGKYVCTQHTGDKACGVDLIVTIPANGHADVELTEATAPTCLTGGTIKANCTVCDLLLDEITTDALGHDFSITVESKNATCTEAGFTEKQCSRCTETHTEVISMLGHKMVAGTPVPETCTTSGYTVYECDNAGCDHSYTVFDKDPTGHTWGEWTTSTNPTATTEGEQRRYCDDCNAFETATLPKLGHDMIASTAEGDYQAPTCTEDGFQVYVCNTHTGDAACSYTYTQTLPKTGHLNITTTKLDPNCTTAGSVITKCSCGDVIAETELPATGHKTYILPAVPATCTQTGLTAGEKCAACGTVTVEQQTVGVLGHTEEVIPAIAATCTTTGLTEGKRCSVCGEITVAQTVTEKLSHNSDTVIPAVLATCTTSGLTEGKKCSVCGTITVEQTVVPATDHDFGTAAVTQATCKVPGTAVFTCTHKCGTTLTAEIPVNENHIWTGWTEINGVLTRECITCGDDESITLPSGGHQFNLNNPTETVDSTCHTAGEKIYKCIAENHTNCTTEIRVALPKTAHAVDMRITKTATCSEKGSVEAYCTVAECGAVLDTLETEIIAHNYNLKKLETPASCSVEGEIIWKCATCEDTKTEKLPKLAHAYNPTSKGGSCLVPAYTTYTCACGASYDVYDGTPARGHSYTNWSFDYSGDVIKATGTCSCSATLTVDVTKQAERTVTEIRITKQPTCNEVGKATVIFDRGEAQTVDIPKNPDAHTIDTDVVLPTCNSDGSVRTYCTVCGETIITETLGKLEHTSVSIIPAVAPTCTQDGKTAGVKCDVCGEILIAQETIRTEGHSYVDNVVAPTCTEQGHTVHKCTKCAYGYQDTFTEALGHDYDTPVFVWNESGSVATAYRRCLRDANHTEGLSVTMTSVSDVPTCLYKGTTTYTATVKIGDNTYTDSNVVVGTLGNHDLIEVAGVEATCTKDGNVAHWKCNTCYKLYADENAVTEYGRDEIILPAGHTEEIIPAVPATCTDTGLTEGKKCSVCGEILLEQEVVDALGHDMITIVAKAPTCMEIGYTAGEKCTRCNKYFGGAGEIPATGHTEEVILGSAPTCTETGLTDKITCSVCGETLRDAEIIEATGHDMGEYVMTKSPTCTNRGEERSDCSACDHYVTRVLDTVSTAHIWGEWTLTTDGNHQRVCKENAAHVETGICYDNEPTEVGATCKDHSYLRYICEKCSYEWRVYDETSEFVDHSYTKFFYNNDATCETDGTKYANCDYGCGTRSENIVVEGSAKNHSWTQWKTVKESTCSSYRIEERKCSLCGKTESRENTAVGYGSHYLIIQSGKAPTCTTDGYEDFLYCVDCGYRQDSAKIPMLGHADDNGDGVCDLCAGPYYEDEEGRGDYCDCMCHKDGIAGFFYKIIKFFWQIFGINDTCECGSTHYIK